MLQDESYSLAALVCGPLFGGFTAWLSKTARRNDLSDVYFASREGYFLKRYWDAWQEASTESAPPASHYLLTSRVSLTRCLLAREDSWDTILRHPYRGGTDHFLKHRLGITDGGLLDVLTSSLPRTLELPADRQRITSELRAHHDPVEAFSAQQLSAMQTALAAEGFDGSSRQALVDIGYSGTIPHLLSQVLMADDFAKLYLVGNATFFRLSRADSFVGQREWGSGDPIIDCSLLLEGLLQAPHGSLRGYSGDRPVFDDVETHTVADRERLDSIHDQGIAWMLKHRSILQLPDAPSAAKLGLSVFIREALMSQENALEFLEIVDLATSEGDSKGWRMQAQEWLDTSFRAWDWIGHD